MTAWTRTVTHPVEMVAGGLVLGALVVIFGARRWRTPWAPRIGLTAALGFVAAGIWLVRLRELATVAAVRQVPRGQLAAHVAREHTSAASGLWWWLLLGAFVCLAAVPWRPRWAALGRGGPALAILVVMASVSGGGEVAVAAAVLALATALGKPGIPAALLALAAAGAGAEAAAGRPLILADPEVDLAMMGRAAAARLGWPLAGIVWGIGVRPPLRAVAVAVAVTAIGIGVWWPAAVRSRTWGPAPDLAALPVDRAPVFVDGRIERLSGGCLWQSTDAGWSADRIGRLSTAHAMNDCIAGRRGPMGEDRPVVLLPETTPVADLLPGGVGELQVVVRLDEALGSTRLTPWRVAVVPVQVLAHDTRWRPMGDPVVVRDGVATRGTTSGSLQEALAGAPVRTDLVALGPDLDVGGFLDLCAEARSLHPVGLRCTLGLDPADTRWETAP